MSARITEVIITIEAPGLEPFAVRAQRNGFVLGGGHGMILNGKWHWSHGFGGQLPILQKEEPRIAALARSVFGEDWGTWQRSHITIPPVARFLSNEEEPP